ncbi:ATP synthase F0 subcomplex subunit H atp14 [Ceratocystis pirilliformis]|uniref:ATP synthase F0 subcomplex subunit H atp14 n=1 Tax=Ceratocystis pirilliformis TaxID=259994 RepID=A0ABR3YSW9_9PEZI
MAYYGVNIARRGTVALVRSVKPIQARTFIVPTAVRRVDYVQDLYLKSLASYKAPAVSAADSEGQVQKFALPKTPVSPEEADLASSLKEYESLAVEVEGSDAAVAADGSAIVQDWLVEEEEETTAAH